MNMRKLVLGVAAATLAAPMGAAVAQTSTTDTWFPRKDRAFEPGYYVGGGVGYFRVDEQDFFENGDDLDDEQVSYKLYAGGDFTSWLSGEVGYINFGEFGDDSELEADGFTVAAIAQWPIGNFAPYAKVGWLWWDADASPANVDDDDGDDVFGGLGVRFSLTEALDMRVEYERYQLDDADLDMGSLNLQYQF